MIPDLDPTGEPASAHCAVYAPHRVQRFEMHSDSGDQYVIHVSWPPAVRRDAVGLDAVGTDAGRAHAVVYMLDGETFPVAREILRYQAGAHPNDPYAEPILVAIGYPGASRRGLDYSPYALAADGRTGGGPAFRRFLLERVRPWVESTFNVDTARQTLMGHSMGGMFVLDTLLDAPGAFQTYVASSPSVWWGDGHLAARVAQAPKLQLSPTRVWISTAEFELALSPSERQLAPEAQRTLEITRQQRNMIDGNRAIAEQLAQHPSCTVSFTTFENETHRSAWPRAIANATRD